MNKLKLSSKAVKLANVNINKLSVIGPIFVWSFLLMSDMAPKMTPDLAYQTYACASLFTPDMALIKQCQLKHPYRLPLKSIPGPWAIPCPNFNYKLKFKLFLE